MTIDTKGNLMSKKKVDPIAAKQSLEMDKLKDDLAHTKDELAFYKGEYDRNKKSDRRTNAIIKSFEDVARTIPPQKLQYSKPIKKKRNAMHCLQYSDIHGGEIVLPEHTAGLTEYNFDIQKQMTERLLSKILLFKEIDGAKHNIDTIWVSMLGDLLHGQKGAGAWESWTFEQDKDIATACICQAELIAEMLNTLSKHYRHVRVTNVPGNHSRTGKRGSEPKISSWDRILIEMVRALLKSNNRITIYPEKDDPRTFFIYEEAGMRFFLEHGDTCRSWMGVPFYGLNRERARNEALAKLSGTDFDHMMVGHFHQPAMIPDGRGFVIVNGAFVGGDAYSVETLHLARPASQNLLTLSHQKIADFRVINMQDSTKGSILVQKGENNG